MTANGPIDYDKFWPLVARLFRRPSLVDRTLGRDDRRAALRDLSSAYDYRVVPDVVGLLESRDGFAVSAAAVLATFVDPLGPRE